MAPTMTRNADSRGYITVWLGSGHPYANSSGWQYEHRLVMMDHLGRRLRKGERVVHRNGDRADNSLDNLVLLADRPPPPHCATCTC